MVSNLEFISLLKESLLIAGFNTINALYADVLYELEFWDVSGSTKWSSMALTYCRNADSFVVVYDITSMVSLVLLIVRLTVSAVHICLGVLFDSTAMD